VAGDPLTMTSVTPRARLVLKSNSSYVVNATSIEQLSISLFKITVNTTLKGLYDLFIEIPDKVGSTNYVNINSSPFISYWESAEAFNTYSLMAGTGIDF
jgi:UDP-N-acetylenolpyruvoylglucosamine reductase